MLKSITVSLHISFLGTSFLLASCSPYPESGATHTEPPPPSDPGAALEWELHPEPVISYGQVIDGMVWNDPSVIKENGEYRMWLSGGVLTEDGNPVVQVYHATSEDGVQWEIDSDSVLPPADSGWDAHRVETPMVLKIDDTYHMYYTGCDRETCAGFPQFAIGHATSQDGIHWERNPNNPIVQPHDNPAEWGFHLVAEPGAAYDPETGTVYLYYTTTKLGGQDHVWLEMSIHLATSTDGSDFSLHNTNRDGFSRPVMRQSAHYPPKDRYMGLSTPWAHIDTDGTFHLFYDVSWQPSSEVWRQVALARAESSDGKRFAEVERDILKTGDAAWLHYEVRAPCVIETEDGFKMWFAGHGSPGPLNDYTRSGIGMAEANFKND